MVCAAIAVLAIVGPQCAEGAPTLQSADIHVVLHTPTVCEVTMKLAVSGGGALDHRVDVGADTDVDLSQVSGARAVQAPQVIGRTRSLVLDTSAGPYELSYSVRRSTPTDRCPLWVPAAPADGVSRAVRITVELPPGSSSRGSLPAFTWNGTTGTASLGHIPAFVRVPYGHADTAPRDISSIMDAMTIVVFVAASGLWLWRRRR